MKALQNTPDTLVLDHRPIWGAILVNTVALICAGIGIWRIGIDFGQGLNFLIVAAVFGFGLNFLVIRRTTLTLDRARDVVEWRRRTMLGATRRSWPLSTLQSAELDSAKSGAGSDQRTTYRAMLNFHDDSATERHLILRPMRSGMPGRTVKTLNAWLKT